MSKRAKLAAGFGLCCVLLTASALAEPCKFGSISFPITMVGLRAQMTAKLNGKHMQFMVDLGDYAKSLTTMRAMPTLRRRRR